MMRPSPFVLEVIRYAMYTLAALMIVMGLVLVVHTPSATPGTKSRLIGEQPATEVPIQNFSAQRVAEGFSAPADTHVLFIVPPGTQTARTVFFGGKETNEKVRYWGYCFSASGIEMRNKQNGLTGMQIYRPEGFFYSLAELNAKNGNNALAADADPATVVQRLRTGYTPVPVSMHEVMSGGETCYLMTSAPLPVGIDTDGDGLNDFQEKLIGTNPRSPDTDGDGASDGQEVFIMHTNPLTVDTDSDGLIDTIEDKNLNGIVDPGETDPTNADTDRDGLCDGDGSATGCPEAKYENVVKTDTCSPTTPYAECRHLPLVRGEDSNDNGILDAGETDPTRAQTYPPLTDWQWKFNQLQLLPDSNRKVP